MRKLFLYVFCLLSLLQRSAIGQEKNARFNFCGDDISFLYDTTAYVDFTKELSISAIKEFYNAMEVARYDSVVNALLAYKKEEQPDDWLYYQLVRRVAQKLSPKAENYIRYTLYKWYLMCKTGYNATLSISKDKILFYIQSDQSIYDIPVHTAYGKQYVCLNYHDYGNIDFEKEKFTPVIINIPEAKAAFSYKVTHLPDFSAADYTEKDLEFNYDNSEYKFKVKVNKEVKSLFVNYPVTDYQAYFEMPLSNGTYNTLIPALKAYTQKMSQREGVNYLMRFTRYAFLYETDRENFGKEKRMSPEETLLYDYSDCEDRSALFFYLVKEIYHLPMIVLAFPEHVTIAVKFDKPIGSPIVYRGEKYSVCEPTPQKDDLSLGQLLPKLRNEKYDVVYVYQPR